MKKLFLIRHAKSDWENLDLKDIERPLNTRGYANANDMSNQRGIKPDLIISSPAVRAYSTALLFARNLNYNANTIILKQELYEATVNDYVSVFSEIDNKYDAVMLFGHNPTISNLVGQLTQSSNILMPTCCIAGINFDAKNWKEIKIGNLFLFDYPKK
jgi:phosphohistidine phosphatase